MSEYLNKNGLTHLVEQIVSKLSLKVDKVDGKGLSTKDYTAADQTKLSGIEAGANKYVHPSYTAETADLYKVAVDATGHVSSATKATKEDIAALGIPTESITAITNDEIDAIISGTST